MVLALLSEQMSVQSGARGLLIAGFPRDLQQLRAFEIKVGIMHYYTKVKISLKYNSYR